TINTPSMLAVEDALDSLKWAESVGGVKGTIARTEANFRVTDAWVRATPWIDYLASDPAFRSHTSVCLRFTDPWLDTQDDDFRTGIGKRIGAILEEEGVAFDIGSYRTAPAGVRIWNGATVETADLEALYPWLDWAWASVKTETEGGNHG
ncbi:MAG: phosphoserine aminotransferase, partial [Alphaproteobacteria bacterium]